MSYPKIQGLLVHGEGSLLNGNATLTTTCAQSYGISSQSRICNLRISNIPRHVIVDFWYISPKNRQTACAPLPTGLLEELSRLSDLNRKFGRTGVRLPETKWSFYGGGIRYTKWWMFLSYNSQNGPRMMEVKKLLRKCFIDEARGYLCIC